MAKIAFSILSILFFFPQNPALAKDIIRPVRVNGCSFSSEGSWGHCCFEHDILYWVGGTFEDRKNADEGLRQCMDESGGESQSATFYNAVRIFGVHIFGKAWAPRDPNSLSPAELEDIRNELALYNSIGQPLGYEFIIQESIMFQPLDADQKRQISDQLTPFSKTPAYQQYLKTYFASTGRRPATLKYHR